MPSSQEIGVLKKNDATRRKNLLYLEHCSRRESLGKLKRSGKAIVISFLLLLLVFVDYKFDGNMAVLIGYHNFQLLWNRNWLAANCFHGLWMERNVPLICRRAYEYESLLQFIPQSELGLNRDKCSK